MLGIAIILLYFFSTGKLCILYSTNMQRHNLIPKRLNS